MDITNNGIKRAMEIALADEKLAKALKEWHRHDGRLPSADRGLSLSDWVCRQLKNMAGCIGEDETVEHLVEALRVNAIGDTVAIAERKTAEAAGFTTDINCYVDDNIVYAAVWLTGKTAEENKKEADRIAANFRKAGYYAELFFDDPEVSDDVDVNAQIDFPLYLKSIGK